LLFESAAEEPKKMTIFLRSSSGTLISVPENSFTPLKTNMEPEHTPLEKEKHLQSTNFEGSMLIFRRFSNALAKPSRFVFLACPACPKVPCQAFAKGVGTLPGVSPHSQAPAANRATMNAMEKKKW